MCSSDLVKEAGEQQPQQILRDSRDGALRRQVFAVKMVDAAELRVGRDEVVGQFGHGFHGGKLPRRSEDTKILSAGGGQNRFHHAINADAIQAAEINRTFAQKARRTRRVGIDQMISRVARQSRPGQFRRRAAERHDHRRAERGGDVHRAGVIG